MGFLSSMGILHKLLGTLHACIDISHHICHLKLKLMPVCCFVTAITATGPLLTCKLKSRENGFEEPDNLSAKRLAA